jgi:hypothetical protein
MTRTLTLTALVLALPVVFAVPALNGAPQADADVEAVLNAARDYLTKYRDDLTAVVATERTTQRINRQVPAEPKSPRARSTTGEVYFRYVSGEDSWMAIREVQTLDGAALENRPNLALALQNQDAATVNKTFKAFNSQFNIGRLVRNFNEPTLALGVLDASRRDHFTFSKKGTKTESGRRLVTVGFKQKANTVPFAYDLLMRPAGVEGEVTVDSTTGAVRKTTIHLTLSNVRATLETTFEHNAKLDLLVPVRFTELYSDGVEITGIATAGMGRQYELIFCESKYSDYKRFSATARIK